MLAHFSLIANVGRNEMRHILLVAICILFSGCCWLSPTHRAIQTFPPRVFHPDADTPLAPGETIWICNANHIEKTPENLKTVGQDGTVHLPFLGRTSIAGLIPMEVENKIQTLYRNSNIFRSVKIAVLRPGKEPSNK